MSRTLVLALIVPLASCASCGSSPSPAPETSGTASTEPDWWQPSEPRPTPPPATPSDPLPSRPDGPARAWSPLGTNLDGPADWSEANPFIDAFRLAREWHSAPAEFEQDDEQAIPLDEHGWVRRLGPQQIVRTGVLWDVPNVRGGRYTVLFDGDGEMSTHGGATRSIRSREPGRMIVDWDPRRDGTGFGVTITRTNPQDPVRNIRVIPPGGACSEDRARFCEQDSEGCECLSFLAHHEQLRFHPDFLATLGSYQTIRFMNWQVTNGSEEATWADRPRLDDASWASGVPPEVMIDLTNRVGAHPWFCLPHRADDGYARGLGRMVREQLDPELSVRVELSNEVWNGIFPQHQYAEEEGARRGLAGPDGDPTFALAHWVARRSREIWTAFDAAFGDRERSIHVLGGFVHNPWFNGVEMEFENTGDAMDELAIAPYFGRLYGPDDRDRVIEGGVDFVLAGAAETLEETLTHTRENAELVQRYEARLVAYEGGQHVVATGPLAYDDEVIAILRDANRDPRMEELYRRYLEGWREAGGALFVHFVNVGGWGRYGFWGALEHPRAHVPSSPKWLALERFARTTRPWW